ncbi:MAG: hypothetical protein QM726_21515 [Chitinophagaceae bacterium]
MLGQSVLSKFFKIPVQADLMGIFLLGLVVSTIYFELISFWLPVNYLCLIPLCLVSIYVTKKNNRFYLEYIQSIRKQILFSPQQYFIFIIFFLLFFSYMVLPPANPDSADYHILSVTWYERFKVVPGLANVHGRFAFNPAAFIIQAAYAFTGLFGQPIYSLNATATGLLLAWILVRVCRNRTQWSGVAYLLLLIITSRLLLANMSGPSSDPLVTVFTSYTLIRVFELIQSDRLTTGAIIIPCISALFAPIAKLSAYPLLLIIPFMLLLTKDSKKYFLLYKLSMISCLIYIPWLIRNYIMSGYLVYPLYFVDFFNPDWKAPKEIPLLDYTYVRYSPKFAWHNATDFENLTAMPFFQWLIPWMKAHIQNGSFAELAILLAALFSPFIWILAGLKKIKNAMPLFLLWLGVYAYTLLWLKTSPDYRFATSFLCCTFIFPFLFLGNKKSIPAFIPASLITIALTVFVIYYEYGGVKLFNRYAVETEHSIQLKYWWLKPLPHPAYAVNRQAGFQYEILQTGVRLFRADKTHNCLCADLPCMSWDYGKIEMRGKNLDEGFRNIQNNVKTNYPFLKN